MNLHWKGAWDRDPVSFEIFDGVPYLALYITDKQTCKSMSPADYTVQTLRWVGGRWVEISQSEFPLDKALMNLSGDYWGRTATSDYKGLIRWEDKRLPGGYKQQHPDTIKSYFERGQRFCREHLSK